jgi:hypothetical protein
MIITSTIAIVSLVLMLYILVHKSRELRTGKILLNIGNQQSDLVVRRLKATLVEKAAIAHPENGRSVLRRLIIEIEKQSMNLFHRLSHRFSMVGDVVTGRDIPKNRGSVSFFLKNIEDSKKQSSL